MSGSGIENLAPLFLRGREQFFCCSCSCSCKVLRVMDTGFRPHFHKTRFFVRSFPLLFLLDILFCVFDLRPERHADGRSSITVVGFGLLPSIVEYRRQLLITDRRSGITAAVDGGDPPLVG